MDDREKQLIWHCLEMSFRGQASKGDERVIVISLKF